MNRWVVAALLLAGCGPRANVPDAAVECVALACAGRTFYCLGGNSYQRSLELDCHESCGPEPCAGATCVATGPVETCPRGTSCADERAAESPCVVVDAGPPDVARPTVEYFCPTPQPQPCPTPPDARPDLAPDVQVTTAQEGQPCSVDPAEDPQLVCAPGVSLACVATLTRNDAPDGGARRLYLCRQPCTTSGECHAGDVCCPGIPQRACVPPAFCEPADGGP